MAAPNTFTKYYSPAAGLAKEGTGISRRTDRAVPDRPMPDQALTGPSISDQVKAEAGNNAQRRSLARKISTGLTPLPSENIADKFRRLAREADEDEAAELAEVDAQERRDRELDRLASPSAVLRRAQRDWPGQCADVAGIAKELGIGLGECWRRVIKAGVESLRDADGEGAVT